MKKEKFYKKVKLFFLNGATEEQRFRIINCFPEIFKRRKSFMYKGWFCEWKQGIFLVFAPSEMLLSAENRVPDNALMITEDCISYIDKNTRK